jgi:hypothetical protein
VSHIPQFGDAASTVGNVDVSAGDVTLLNAVQVNFNEDIMLFLSGYYHNVDDIYAIGHVHIHLLFHKEVYHIIDHQNAGKVLCRKKHNASLNKIVFMDSKYRSQ